MDQNEAIQFPHAGRRVSCFPASHRGPLANIRMDDLTGTIYLRCKRCGWVHFAVSQDGGNRCFRCAAPVDLLELVAEPDVPLGVTLQGITWPVV